MQTRFKYNHDTNEYTVSFHIQVRCGHTFHNSKRMIDETTINALPRDVISLLEESGDLHRLYFKETTFKFKKSKIDWCKLTKNFNNYRLSVNRYSVTGKFERWFIVEFNYKKSPA